MNWVFEKLEKPEFIRIVTDGLFSSADFVKLFDELFSLSYWHRRIPLLMDDRKMDLLGIPSIELMDASDHFISLNDSLAFTKISVLYGSNEALETGRRFGRITESGSKALVQRFMDEGDALDWIVPHRHHVAYNGFKQEH